MSSIEHFSIYFKSANDVPVERAVIPATVAEGVIADFEQLRLIAKEQHEALKLGKFMADRSDRQLTTEQIDAAMAKYEAFNER